MRPIATFLFLTLLLVLVPGGVAHMDDCGEGPGTELCHLVVNTQEVPAKGEHVYPLHSERIEGDFPKDWILTAYGGVQGNRSLLVNITLQNETRHQWTWSGNAFSSNSTRIDETGHYELRVVNPWDQPIRYQFYFDQSCSCTFKVIPINGGFVLFNYDIPAGRDVRLAFPTIDGWHVRGTVATLDGDDAAWPQDYETVTTTEQKGKGWLELRFKTGSATTHYAFIEALSGVAPGPDGRPVPVSLTPLLEVEEAKSPGLVIPLFLGALLAAAALRRRND